MALPNERRYFNPQHPATGHCTSLFGHRSSLTVDKLRRLAAAGCRHVEISALQQLHLDMFDESRIEQLVAEFEKLPLTCWSLHAPFCALADDDGETRADAARLLELTCHRARQFGCGLVVVHPGRDVPSVDAARELTWTREGLCRVLDGVEGVTLAVETMSDPAERLLEMIDGLSGVGVCFDSGHVHTRFDVCDYVRALDGHIVTVHLHDNGGQRDEHNPPGMGTIDWPAMLTALHTGGYDGVLINEGGAGGEDVDDAIAYFADYMLTACRYIP